MMDEMAEECQYRFPEEKIPPSIFMTVYHCAKSDQVKSLVAALNDIPNQELHTYLLNARFEENDGQTFTPLVLAARYGNSNFIRTILDRYNLDLECEGNVLFDGLIVYGVTALWTAAMMGYLNIVKFLVHRGANINHNTKTNSSPLRAACYMGRLDIVKYLINHGADVNLANIYKNTCIMIASYKGHTPVVEALLKAGADPNEQALCSATALHYAAEGDHLEVCELLLDHGAKLQKNEHGLTPVLQAADRSHANIVEMFINRPGIMTTHDKIVALELMGASFATDKKNYNVVSAYQYLMNAMEIRYMDPDNIIRKRTLPPIPAYDNWIETETIQDLQAIRLNHHSIHMEALTVRERILGKNHPDLPQPIVYRGAIFADQERFEMSCTLWNYAIDLRMNNDLSVERDLLRFAQLFSQMIRLERNLDISLAVSVLVKCQQEIENNRRKIASPGQKDDVHRIADELDSNVVTALYLTKIITILIGTKPHDDSQIRLVYTALQNLIRADTKLRDGQTLLHRALNGVTPVDNFYTSEVCRFPCYQTALVLISAKAPVTAEDCERNTPLHVLISSIRRDNPSHINEAEKCIRILAHAGAHLDAVNAQGLTAAQLSTVASVSTMLVKYQNQFSSLKCIAARSVAFYKLKYKGFIPTILEKFVHMHSTEKLDV